MAALVWRVPGHVHRPQVNFHGCCLHQIADPAVNADRALMTVTHATDFFHDGSRAVNAVAFNPKKDNEVVSASDDRLIKVWSLADGQCKQTIYEHS